MKIRNGSRAIVALLAVFAIGGSASAAQIPGDDGDEEIVLSDTEKASVGDGFIFLLSLGFAGDFWGTKDKKYTYVDSAPSQPAELGAALSMPPIGRTQPLVPISPLREGEPSANVLPAPEPSAALLMAMGMVLTGMHLRGRRSD